VSARPAFRLERVRGLRERAEDEAREAYARTLQHHARGAAELARAAERVGGARGAHRAALGGPVAAAELLAHQAFLERTERAEQAAELEAHRRDAELEAAAGTLRHAARERQVLERLKERQLAAHRREAERREAAALDELALAVHRRREAR
jgi:flagellar FliJ protein